MKYFFNKTHVKFYDLNIKYLFRRPLRGLGKMSLIMSLLNDTLKNQRVIK